MADQREILRADVLDGTPHGTPHGFLTGVGHTGEPDPALLVPGGKLVLTKQVHSAKAIAVESPYPDHARPEVDGLVTKTPGVILGIVTADCAPVLFADIDNGVIGAAHAGWRGAHYGVLEATVRKMEELGAERTNIAAAIGPTIAEENYEVGFDFYEQFEDRHADFFRRGRPGKWHFNLPAYVLWRLESLNLGQVEDLGVDTYANPERFHSYRRATHQGKAQDGRQFSLIGLPD
ncbi:peptidoglycan editing factor PgeF [Aurantiacibacter sediminis]|uniref:Purine nucleoside phosphorylase n=1 Tax=Aurantiacibacter sediminis TaxID=2793064 RepID=A0ABS0N0K4_9SPHN|nr:peptidoglycan editing factor PgeF [Aurantiacibacter sediminis]MBH5321495.1 peptidoglycan editing factor PgeF [Aurantiacibacter sediminis]